MLGISRSGGKTPNGSYACCIKPLGDQIPWSPGFLPEHRANARFWTRQLFRAAQSSVERRGRLAWRGVLPPRPVWTETTRAHPPKDGKVGCSRRRKPSLSSAHSLFLPGFSGCDADDRKRSVAGIARKAGCAVVVALATRKPRAIQQERTQLDRDRSRVLYASLVYECTTVVSKFSTVHVWRVASPFSRVEGKTSDR
jgi:hypothetical protein